jgi:1,2-dihydroxy-3-keto-5-methylthiopentene dioxygenase
MSRLTIYPEGEPQTIILQTSEAGEIATALAPLAVRFERWPLDVPLTGEEAAEEILEAYRPHLDRLMGATGAGSADVVKLTPGHPQAAPLRAKFLQEHTHTEDEVRFFVAGSGNFLIHENGHVYDAHCTAGDLISVPANYKHWFEAGEEPLFTVLRIFTDTSGWVPYFTGDDISVRFPAVTEG